MSRAKPFKSVPSNFPRRSLFDLSYEKKFTCDMGSLIPVMCDEVVPGDSWKIANQAVIRFNPMTAPVLHEINMYVHYFFVPYRILWEDWEDFITGGIDGNDASVLPKWIPSQVSHTNEGSLWDYMGMPTGIIPSDNAYPIEFPKSAYYTIYNEYYRDETLSPEVNIATAWAILNRSWEKDYFTSALPWQQRGTAPSLPISGTSQAVWDNARFNVSNVVPNQNPQFDDFNQTDVMFFPPGTTNAHNSARLFMNNNTVDLSSATTFDVADLRLVFQIQKWLERNARAGARYTEFLKAHFGVAPRDERLQRPEYIGGTKSPVIISEVLQTSEDGTSPQGNLAGHGLALSDSYVGKYNVKEYGLIMGIMSVIPRTTYSQGINRQWLKYSKYDFFHPEFVNLSEQAIENAEIFTSDVSGNRDIFGYQGIYDEMRTKQSMICGQMRTTFNYWHLGREFSSAPALNSDFVKCAPRKDIFAVDTEPGLIVNFANKIRALRPMPAVAEPGLIDHN